MPVGSLWKDVWPAVSLESTPSPQLIETSSCLPCLTPPLLTWSAPSLHLRYHPLHTPHTHPTTHLPTLHHITLHVGLVEFTVLLCRRASMMHTGIAASIPTGHLFPTVGRHSLKRHTLTHTLTHSHTHSCTHSYTHALIHTPSPTHNTYTHSYYFHTHDVCSTH